LNTLGSMFGYGFYYFLNKKQPLITQKFKR